VSNYKLSEQKQAEKYMTQLENRFEWLVKNPDIGMDRKELKEGYRSYFEGKHTIFYRKSKIGIEIIGVPNQSEDVIQHMSINDIPPEI